MALVAGINHLMVQVTDLDAVVEGLRTRGARIRNEISVGVGVRQALVLDPAGNLVELFEPRQGYHERGPR